MNHWIIFPILIPAIVAPLIVLTSRFDQVLARVFSTGATVLMLFAACVLYAMSLQGVPIQYSMGNWLSPYGIVLVLDRLSASMLLLSGIIGFVIALATIDGWDQRGRHFHSLFLMQLGGINGAFLTGDLFNLFVCFEVMLIASYGLMVHGGGAARLRAGIQFVVTNLCGSTLFLIAMGLVYGATGGLNMSDVAEKVSTMPPANRSVMSCGIALLMMVFALKAALVPLHFWLPCAYANAPPLVAALFAIGTKVGIYCLIRVYGIIIVGNENYLSEWTHNWIAPSGLITIVIGMIGVLASRALGQLVSYATLASTGTILTCLALFNPQTLSSGMYYLINSTLAGAALFFVVDAIVHRRQHFEDRLMVGERIPHSGLLGGLFMACAVAMIGIPPLSGFIGKLLILDSVRNSEWSVWIWMVILSTSVLGIIGFARAGSTLFWKSHPNVSYGPNCLVRSTPMTLIACGLLLAIMLGLTVGAQGTLDSLRLTAFQLCRME